MALIVEVIDRSGAVRTRLRLDGRPVTVGRGYDNDVILDDQYVDARHARIRVAEDGTAEIEDLGSVNGLVAVGSHERVPRLAVPPGGQVRIGRTTLRFRDPAEPVPPALAEPAYGVPDVAGLIAKPWFRAAAAIGAIGLVTLYTWMSVYGRESASVALAAGFGYALLGVMWSGGWAIASRVVLNRFHFIAHYTVFSALTIPMMLYTTAAGWALFLFPDNIMSAPVGVVVMLVLSVASIALHLSLASAMSRLRRWRAGAIVTGVMAAMFGLLVWAGSQLYTDVPTFSGVLKPVSGRALPAIDVARFSDVVDELTTKADAMAQE